VRFLPANKPSVYYEFLIPDGDESPNSLLSRCRGKGMGADVVDVLNDKEWNAIMIPSTEMEPSLKKGKEPFITFKFNGRFIICY
ncbi:hypothetical protein Tcan_04792, partial [Toxocara canis]